MFNQTSSALAAITVLKKVCDHPALLSERAAHGIVSGVSRARRQAAARLGGGSFSGEGEEEGSSSDVDEIEGSSEEEWESGEHLEKKCRNLWYLTAHHTNALLLPFPLQTVRTLAARTRRSGTGSEPRAPASSTSPDAVAPALLVSRRSPLLLLALTTSGPTGLARRWSSSCWMRSTPPVSAGGGWGGGGGGGQLGRLGGVELVVVSVSGWATAADAIALRCFPGGRLTLLPFRCRAGFSASCKTVFVMGLLKQLVPEGHRTLVFSQSRVM